MQEIKVKVDRPIGYVDNFNNTYEINYGYVPGLIGGDGEEQDVYIISNNVSEPIDEFYGKLVAIIYRADDVECKWVVTGIDENITINEIINKTFFIEKYFDSTVFMPIGYKETE